MPDAIRRRTERRNYVIPARRDQMETSFGKRKKRRSNNNKLTLKTINKLIKELKKM
jgi:hypothetical protein